MSILFKRINDWATSITTFRTGDVIPVDGPSGTAKMSKDDLLRMAAENALAGNLAPAYSDLVDYDKGQLVIKDANLYRFLSSKSAGAWDGTKVALIDSSKVLEEKITGPAVKNLVAEIIDGKYVSVQNLYLSLVDNAEYKTAKVILNGAKYVSFKNVGSMNFSKIFDASDKYIGELKNYKYNSQDTIFEMPENAASIYTSASNASFPMLGGVVNIVAIETKNVVDFNVDEFPYGVEQGRNTENLFSVKKGKKVDEFPFDEAALKKVDDSLENVCADLSTWVAINSASLVRNTSRSGTATFNDTWKGFTLGRFNANSSKVRIVLKGTKTGESFFVILRYYDSQNVSHDSILGITTDNTYDLLYTFDAAYYAVYKDAVSFDVYVGTSATSASVTPVVLTITEFYVTNSDTLQASNDYDPNLRKMLGNMEVSIASAGAKVSSEGFFGAPNGHLYKMQIDSNGTLNAIPTIPNKTLFVGNSLLFGMDENGTHGGAFGMCATSPTKDYAYLVEQAILALNPSATFAKLKGTFEMATTDQDAANWFDDNSASFTNDLDLVIVQIGDNVNTEIKKQVFRDNYGPNLLERIRIACPKARVFCICGWFNAENTLEIVSSNATKYGADFLNISPLHTTSNEATSGQVVTYYDDTTAVVSDSWITHPGDAGFSAIATEMIKTLNMS